MSPVRPTPAVNLPKVAACLAGGIASIAIMGWVFSIPVLTTLIPGLVSMKANTAFTFLLLAACLYLAAVDRSSGFRALLAGIGIAVGSVTLLEYATGMGFGIDQLLFKDFAISEYPGRPSPITSFNFALLGIALLPLRRKKINEILAEVLALVVLANSMFAVIGYLYGIPLLYGAISSSTTAMALHTGGNFVLLALGALFIPRDLGLVRIFRGNSIAAIVARYLVPAAIFIPVVLGAVFMHNRFSMGHLSLAMALIVVSNVVLLVALIWYFSFFIERTERERAALQQQAYTDRLTGIHNRRFFDDALEREMERTRRYSGNLSLIIFDLDHFKQLNDRYGHLIGDKTLVAVARQCESQLRSTDIFCRYGGEEFVVIAPETTDTAAMLLAGRIREQIAALKIEGCTERLTISAGVASMQQGFTTHAFIAAADQALYQAKQGGRNRECLFGAVDRLMTSSGAN